ncbi:MAG: flavin reductase family protein [Coriobacteriia bacterium]|nr:flavin reductase family protein [Coriobacteriia bacterium]
MSTHCNTAENQEWEQVEGRDVSALLDPRPTIIIGATGERKSLGFATIIWVTPVSHKPAMLAFALRESSYTMSLIQKCGCFSINVLPATPEAGRLAQVCGTRSGWNMLKDGLIPHRYEPVSFDREETRRELVHKKGLFRKEQYKEVTKTYHEESKVPIVECATSWLACKVDSVQPAGDHLLVVGTVLTAMTTAPRNAQGHLAPTNVLQCIQHECFGMVRPFDETDERPAPPPVAAPVPKSQ